MNLKNKPIQFFAYLSILAAILTISLKGLAYIVTSSVGMLSDSIESFINLATAIITLYAIKFAQEPEDERHQFGHSKIEYFSSFTEGLLILIASCMIILSSIERFFHPTPIESIGLGLSISVLASIVNAGAAYIIFQGSKIHHSIALKADAHHLMVDVYTSVGIIVGVFFAYFFNILILDPIIAVLVGLNILKSAIEIITHSFHGLLDESLSKEEVTEIEKITHDTLKNNILNHNILFKLKSRVSGKKKFLYFNIAIPNEWNIVQAHNLTIILENILKTKDSNIVSFIHLEPEKDFSHN